MFWKKKKKSNSKNTASDFASVILQTETIHAKSIVNGKLYDTKKATMICLTKDYRYLFLTEKGNYFSCATGNNQYRRLEENAVYQIFEITYSDIRPETEQYAKENIGMRDVEKYIELFGEVEEA